MNNQLQKNLRMGSTILAPLLLVISQFYWVNGVFTSTAGALQVLSFLFWIFAFQGMFEKIKEVYPKYEVWGFSSLYTATLLEIILELKAFLLTHLYSTEKRVLN